jgi:hypothetical protein
MRLWREFHDLLNGKRLDFWVLQDIAALDDTNLASRIAALI